MVLDYCQVQAQLRAVMKFMDYKNNERSKQ
jgi:hypothetical protein